MSENAKPRRKTSAALWVIIGLCAAPMIASYIAYYFWPPQRHVNYGELLEPRNVADAELVTSDGRPLRISAFRGTWLMVNAEPAACNESCQRKLVYMRQVRLALGKDKERVERLWLVTSPEKPNEGFLREHEGLIVAHDPAGALTKALPAAGSLGEHVYVIDPLGHVMLRFPPDPEPKRMLKDMSRLLRHSKWK